MTRLAVFSGPKSENERRIKGKRRRESVCDGTAAHLVNH